MFFHLVFNYNSINQQINKQAGNHCDSIDTQEETAKHIQLCPTFTEPTQRATKSTAHYRGWCTCTRAHKACVCHILANRQILGKKRDLLFRHNGDLARTHKYTHTHTLLQCQFQVGQFILMTVTDWEFQRRGQVCAQPLSATSIKIWQSTGLSMEITRNESFIQDIHLFSLSRQKQVKTISQS